MSSKCSTKQYISVQFCAKQMSKIWWKNIQAFLRYNNFRVVIFILPHPVQVFVQRFLSTRLITTITVVVMFLQFCRFLQSF